MRDFIEPALTRLRYLYPAANFMVTATGIEVSADAAAEDALVREINYALYREKIYAETLPLRRALIEAVTRR